MARGCAWTRCPRRGQEQSSPNREDHSPGRPRPSGAFRSNASERRGEAATSPVSCFLDQWVLFDEAHVASKAAEIPPEPVAPSGIERAAEAAAVPAPMKVTSVAPSIGAAEPRPKLAEMTRGTELSGADPIAVHMTEGGDAVCAQCCSRCSTGER